jgi:homoserine kinase type II
VAIYTPFHFDELARVTDAFGIGRLEAAEGVPQGSINTNYRLTAAGDRYFLRHTTVRSAADLVFEAALVDFLAAGAFPAPRLVRTREGAAFLDAQGGRVSVFHFLAGEELTRAGVTPERAEHLGGTLGRMHRLTQSFSGDRANPYSVGVVRAWMEALASHPDPEVAEFVGVFREHVVAERPGDLLPRGVIHADLFLDNVKWVGEHISAFFDFEMACRDVYALDLAITVNAWCFDGAYDFGLARALVRGYIAERPLAEGEGEALHGLMLFGAIRYTASRIRDFHLSALPPERLQRKDFRTYWVRAQALAAMAPRTLREKLGIG